MPLELYHTHIQQTNSIIYNKMKLFFYDVCNIAIMIREMPTYPSLSTFQCIIQMIVICFYWEKGCYYQVVVTFALMLI